MTPAHIKIYILPACRILTYVLRGEFEIAVLLSVGFSTMRAEIAP